MDILHDLEMAESACQTAIKVGKSGNSAELAILMLHDARSDELLPESL